MVPDYGSARAPVQLRCSLHQCKSFRFSRLHWRIAGIKMRVALPSGHAGVVGSSIPGASAGQNCAPERSTEAAGAQRAGISARWEQRTLAKQKKILGATPRRWLEYLVAILFGNAIYYKSLWSHLPESLQHQGFAVDPGMLVDFVICVAIYGLIRLGSYLHS